MNQMIPRCDGTMQKLYVSGDFSSDAEFYVAVGVLAFLYIIGAVALYCYFSHMYENNPLVPLVVSSGIFLSLFLSCWCHLPTSFKKKLFFLILSCEYFNIFEWWSQTVSYDFRFRIVLPMFCSPSCGWQEAVLGPTVLPT